MRHKIKALIFALFSAFSTSCGTIAGGSSYNAHIVVNDRPKATISYQGTAIGRKNASLKVKRNHANKFSFTLSEQGCPDQTFSYTKRAFRGWALTGSILVWTSNVSGVLIPWGIGLDFITGALWKPSTTEKGIIKSNYKNYVYPVNYTTCEKAEEIFENVPLIDVVFLRNGKVVKGIIVEQIPSESIKIQLADGSVITIKVSEIVRMTRE